MTDVYDAVRPILTVSKILGMAPFSVSEDPKSLEVSHYSLAYTLILLLLLTGLNGYVFYDVMRTDHSEETVIQRSTNMVISGCDITIGLCSIAQIIVQRNKITAMVNGFRDVSRELELLDATVPSASGVLYSRVTLAALFFVHGILFVYDYLIGKGVNSEKGFPFWAMSYTTKVHSILMMYHFVSGALWLKLHFARLNRRLSGVGDESGSSDRDGKKIDWISGNDYFGVFDSPKFPSVTAPKGDFSRFRLRKVSPVNVFPSRPSTTLGKIKAIRKIHSNLCEIKDLLNTTFSLQLLISVAQSFIIITSYLYMLFTNTRDSSDRAYPTSFFIIWTLYRGMQLVCIVQACTRTCQKANHAAVVVHKLLAREWGSDVRNQLKLFSIQLLHREISFSACGFFTLDMTLLHSIIGAATTYLVILIQFHNSNDTSA